MYGFKFLTVDELHQTHKLVRHGNPKDRFCFYQSGRMSLLVVFAFSGDLRNNSEVCRVLNLFQLFFHKRILSLIHGGLLTEPYVIVT